MWTYQLTSLFRHGTKNDFEQKCGSNKLKSHCFLACDEKSGLSCPITDIPQLKKFQFTQLQTCPFFVVMPFIGMQMHFLIVKAIFMFNLLAPEFFT
jgi:hypothetical protein